MIQNRILVNIMTREQSFVHLFIFKVFIEHLL